MTQGGSTRRAFGEEPILPPILASGPGFAVLNKPAGLPCHAGPRGGASVEDCFPLLSKRKDGPWLAHRLDADTSGCLLIALRKSLLIEAQAKFAAGEAGKIYWAVVAAEPPEQAGIIDAPLLKISNKQGWRMGIDAKGDRAITEWRVMGRAPGICWIAFKPRTGRTHQLRVHATLLGGAILGDPVYGGAPGGRLHLLARALDLRLAAAEIRAEAPPPAHMREALGRCGWEG